jgi:asparagine synthase (glutamine-hydrolysing)
VLGTFGRLEFTHYLQNQLLKDTDVMSMAHSVETRVPYLDHRLVEYVIGLPAAIKLDGNRPKPLLLAALGTGLPREVWNRRKMGFTFPFQLWMKQRLEQLREASGSTNWLQRRAAETVWRDYKEGRAHWSRPWALLALTAIEAERRRGRSVRQQ